uniref:Protein kinase domain-containing protein n=1 Tax=Panagrolaimus sp. ES5 TaxID=591445 RepID=A0AC34FBW8_9BILA
MDSNPDITTMRSSKNVLRSVITSSLFSTGTINYDLYERKRLEEDFEELTALGEGGFGKVVKAKDKTDNMEYAVKMIVTSDKIVEEIKNEIATLAQLVMFKSSVVII